MSNQKRQTKLQLFELSEMYQKILELTEQTTIPILSELLDTFDSKEYVAARIYSNKEWAPFTRNYGRNYVMAHRNGISGELRNKRIRTGCKNITDKIVYAQGMGFCIIKRADINSVNTYNTVRKFIEADIPIYIEGYSGWGKSSIVNQIAQDLEMPIITLSLASISPEDFGGIPRVQEDDNYFKYILPEWALRYKEPFILFLDEINQAPISVLHACYGLVLDRVLNGRKLPCKIVAAGNFLSENEYLTDLSAIKPLMERFYKYTISHDKAQALTFLEQKYDLQLGGLLSVDWELTELNPRRIEKYINMIMAGITSTELATDPEVPCEAAFYTLERLINGTNTLDEDVRSKASKMQAGRSADAQVEDGAETAIFNEIMEHSVA